MGPLAGIRVIEMKGIGPGPYAGMLLADMGAEVVVVERSFTHAGIGLPPERDIHSRGKASIVIDVKTPAGLGALLRLIQSADMLIEGFRPGVAERLGFGPDVCLEQNERLIYGRITGWGQTGPLAGAAGHDINYIAVTGALAAIGARHKPVPPLNLLGDYAGGSLFLVAGMLAALVERGRSGKGQVVDAAITDGVASLMSICQGLAAAGSWQPVRESNLLDGGAPFYAVYETADGAFVAIGSIEPQFYELLIEKTGLDLRPEDQFDATTWPQQAEALAAMFRTRTQAEWCELLEGSDVCFAPVLDFQRAPQHPHNRRRGTYFSAAGIEQPAPAPRFSRTPSDQPMSPKKAGADTEKVLRGLGMTDAEIQSLLP